MRGRKFCITATIVLIVGLAGIAQTSFGQARWVQTVQVVAPIDEEPATSVLLDTLDVLLQDGGITVQREPDGETYSYEGLERQLSGDGLHIYSATHLFITYRFNLTPHNFNVQVRDLHFIYRSPQINEADVPILYLDASNPEIEQLLKQNGLRRTTNEAAMRRFWDQLTFYQLEETATVVQVGNQVIRDSTEAARQKERLMQIGRKYSYQ